MTRDRAIPFSISIPLSKLERLEQVLKLAVSQGRLTGDPNRPNKLAAEALIWLTAQWEAEFRAQGLLAAAPVLDAARLATDPDARAKARAAQGFDSEQPSLLEEPPGIDWTKTG